ncbi:MSC_0623 family F1-like ATPase-associated protein [[Mycoplasma] testudinis]|uniref:MSC_0623 family F1-like ATPase-associated protein n=1 Tax=[Mycoplasma] testudinis TaxID=33924 RepID=UPI000486BBB7|nr:DUF2714 domain-containing protein [[Mycoplasma] testudinis]
MSIFKAKKIVSKETVFEQETDIYDKYDQIVQLRDFISFNQLLGSTMLMTNEGPDSKVVDVFKRMLATAYDKRYDIVFNSFVISWVRNIRISLTKLIPTLDNPESSNVDALNTTIPTESAALDAFFKMYNTLINAYCIDENRYIEVIPNVVVYKIKGTTKLKIAFNAATLAKAN